MNTKYRQRLLRVANILNKIADFSSVFDSVIDEADLAPVIKEIKDDYRRRAITTDEQDDLLQKVRRAESLEEAWDIVNSFRKLTGR